jgi:hypothetical protein
MQVDFAGAVLAGGDSDEDSEANDQDREDLSGNESSDDKGEQDMEQPPAGKRKAAPIKGIGQASKKQRR